MTQLPHADASLPKTETHTGAGENGPRIPKPTGHIGSEAGEFPGSQFIGPKILPTRVGHSTGQLRQRGADAGRDENNPKQAIYDQNCSTGVDTGNQGCRDTPPGVRHAERNTNQGEDTKVPAHILGVSHVGQLEGVGIQLT